MSATGSVSSMSTFKSGFSTFVWLRNVTAPLPMSPEQANLTPSLVASIATVDAVSYVIDSKLAGQMPISYPTPTKPLNLCISFGTPPMAL